MKRIAPLAVALLVVAVVGLRWVHIQHAEFEVDELQHLHGAYLVARGATPYVDFFEHHTPLFYLAAGPFLDPEAAGAHTVLAFRVASLVAHLLTLLLAIQLGRAAGPYGRVVAAAYAATETFSFGWGSLAFLDSFAAPFVLLAAVLLSRVRGAVAMGVAGAACSVAVLLTQKGAFTAIAAVVLSVMAFDGESRAWRKRLESLAALVLGALTPIVAVAFRLGVDGLLGFVRDAVLLNTEWIAHRLPLGEGFLALAYNGPIWVLAALGLLGALHRGYAGALSRDIATPVAFLGAQLLGILALPVVWYEYFIQIGPLVAVIAAFATVDLARRAGWVQGREALLVPGRPTPRVILALLAATALVGLVARSFVGHYSPTLTSGSAVLVLAGTLGGFWWAHRAPDASGRVRLAAVITAVLLLPAVSHVGWLERPSNAWQRRALTLVHAEVGPDDRVFDGYSGLGAFRLHAYRYWFLHDEMVQMLPPAELERDALARLEDPAVRVVLRDEHFERLPGAIKDAVETRFRKAAGIVWVRSDVVTGPAGPAGRQAASEEARAPSSASARMRPSVRQ